MKLLDLVTWREYLPDIGLYCESEALLKNTNRVFLK